MMKIRDELYVKKRLYVAWWKSILFYINRVFPIKKNKIVICTIEGTTGYMCNPKYIVEEIINRGLDYDMVWLVNDTKKIFPQTIRVKKNTLWNRAHELSTAKIWIDNSRKQHEARKRRAQMYIQTWHGKVGFKPTGLDRGKSFSKIAYLVSKHDSEMIDLFLTNSAWFEKKLSCGMLYDGNYLRTGSPRCDILLRGRGKAKKRLKTITQKREDTRFLLYAPTFQGGNQSRERRIQVNERFPDFNLLIDEMHEKFGHRWYVLLRLHPQLVARNLGKNSFDDYSCDSRIIDISQMDDVYEILAGCDALITDYSSIAFDAAVMRIPIFLFAPDYRQYEQERGSLYWKMEDLPFPFSQTDRELHGCIQRFDPEKYFKGLEKLFLDTEIFEDGKASKRVVDFLERRIANDQ